MNMKIVAVVSMFLAGVITFMASKAEAVEVDEYGRKYVTVLGVTTASFGLGFEGSSFSMTDTKDNDECNRLGKSIVKNETRKGLYEVVVSYKCYTKFVD